MVRSLWVKGTVTDGLEGEFMNGLIFCSLALAIPLTIPDELLEHGGLKTNTPFYNSLT
jgi:hypothetical protein